MTDDVLIRERLARAAGGATPTPDLDAVVRRSRAQRRRRAAGTSMIATVLALGVAVPLSMLSGLRDDRAPATPEASGPSPSDEPSPSSSATDGPVVIAPSGWVVQEAPFPALISPRTVVAAGTYEFPRPPLIACGVQPALEQLPAGDVFLWIFEYGRPGEGDPGAGDHPAWPARFRLDLPHREGDRECAAGTADVRDYRFWATDHTVQVFVGIGADASDRLLSELEDVVSSFEP
jgi:hypothetical protein